MRPVSAAKSTTTARTLCQWFDADRFIVRKSVVLRLDTGVVADISRDWNPVGPGDGLFEVLSDYDDWANLSYLGILDSDGLSVLSSSKELATARSRAAGFRRR